LPNNKIKDKNKLVRFRVCVRGIVQGVGFRPFVFHLAKNYSLAGYVLNNTRGVDIEVEGEEKNIKKFLRALHSKSPPLAVIEDISFEKLPVVGYSEFKIESSRREKESFLPISPDIGTCDDCLRELFDPKDRRYLYPFINCTNCGPRFTIVKDIPYDRANTTMSSFKMCKECDREYHDPFNRRFHAQPNACPICGPSVKLLNRQGEEIKTEDPISSAAELIRKGYILAVKGIGGYHLACDATNSEIVKRLRERKSRMDKPFALMMRDLDQIRMFCTVNPDEENLLLSPRKPIVLLKKKDKDILPEQIAPKNKYLGVMLPYTPLHYILLEKVKIPLVMTSGNISEEPIAYKDDDALNRLGKIADAFLVHNREIQIRVDDSVARVVEGKEMLIRRSRGFAPQPFRVKNIDTKKCILAVGPHLKNTFCILKKGFAIVSHHIGDLENLAAFSALEEGVKHYIKIFRFNPEVVACDLHPNYLSTNFAREYSKNNSLPLIQVQHHHAHIVSLLTEAGINEKVIGVCFDGAGLGSDGNLWGGEFFIANLSSFIRIAHLRYVYLPGGEAAIKEPWRIALSYLNEIYKENCIPLTCQLVGSFVESKKIILVYNLLKKRINCPLISSGGRLFDAVAAILGIRYKVNYEGQAAVELEMLATDREEKPYPFKVVEKESSFIVDTLPLIKAVVDEQLKEKEKEIIATKFHWSVSHIILKVVKLLRKNFGLNKVALSGGVFQNVLLLRQTLFLLKSAGFEVFCHRFFPPNDGGISLGQAVIAHEKIRNGCK